MGGSGSSEALPEKVSGFSTKNPKDSQNGNPGRENWPLSWEVPLRFNTGVPSALIG